MTIKVGRFNRMKEGACTHACAVITQLVNCTATPILNQPSLSQDPGWLQCGNKAGFHVHKVKLTLLFRLREINPAVTVPLQSTQFYEMRGSAAGFNRIYFSALHTKRVNSVAEPMRQVKRSCNGNSVRALHLNQRWRSPLLCYNILCGA